MAGQKGVKNVKYLRSRHKSTKARKCKFNGCIKTIREENKSGYCSAHYDKSPMGKIIIRKITKKQRDKNISIHLDREVHDNFADYCEEYGFSKKKKLDLIVKEFLKKENEGRSEQ